MGTVISPTSLSVHSGAAVGLAVWLLRAHNMTGHRPGFGFLHTIYASIMKRLVGDGPDQIGDAIAIPSSLLLLKIEVVASNYYVIKT